MDEELVTEGLGHSQSFLVFACEGLCVAGEMICYHKNVANTSGVRL